MIRAKPIPAPDTEWVRLLLEAYTMVHSVPYLMFPRTMSPMLWSTRARMQEDVGLMNLIEIQFQVACNTTSRFWLIGHILVLDRASSEYYNIAINVVKCSIADLLQDLDQSKFVIVYNNSQGLHCVYLNKVENGKVFN